MHSVAAAWTGNVPFIHGYHDYIFNALNASLNFCPTDGFVRGQSQFGGASRDCLAASLKLQSVYLLDI